MFHHLCTSLKGAVGQVLWDISPRATMPTSSASSRQALELNFKLNVLWQSCVQGGELLVSPSSSCIGSYVDW